jgi:hypothetical protein
MPLPPTIPLLRLILPHKNLLTTKLIHDSRFHRDTGNSWLAYLYTIPIREEENIIQLNLFTDLVGQLLNIDVMSFLGAVLPTATFYDCIHTKPPKRTGIRDAGG